MNECERPPGDSSAPPEANAPISWGEVTLSPPELPVGHHGTWKITYVVGQHPLESGGDIRIRPYGNPLVRPPGQTVYPRGESYVTATSPPGTSVELECSEWLVVTLTVLEGTLNPGDEITVTYGDQRYGGPGMEVRAPAYDLHFRLSVRCSADEEPVALPERPLLRLVPAEPAQFLIKAPSVVSEDEDFKVLVRCVDKYGNTVEECRESLTLGPVNGLELPDEVTLGDSGPALSLVECQRSGKIPVPRIRIAAHEGAGAAVAWSNPIEVNANPGANRIYWGDLHCHSDLEQGLEPVDYVYRYARDEEKLDFLCHVEHYSDAKTRWTGKRYKTWKGGVPSVAAYNEDTWEYRKGLAETYHEPGRFVTLLGHEWASNVYGHVNVYFPGDDAPLLYPPSPWDPDYKPTKLWEALEGHEAVIVPHHPSAPVGTGNPPDYWALGGYDWHYYNEELVRLVEIYSKHGSAEYFGCPRAPFNQQVDGCVQTALRKGHKLGFVGASDTHASRPGSNLYQDHTYAQSGLTAVFAPSLDRGAIYQALKQRRCYATTGQHIILRFWLNGAFMGGDVRLQHAEQVKDVRIEVATPGEIDTVELLKNGKPFYRYNGHLTPDLGWWRDNGWEMEVRTLDREVTTGTDYYYVRVTQRDGAMAWSSPIWVSADYGEA